MVRMLGVVMLLAFAFGCDDARGRGEVCVNGTGAVGGGTIEHPCDDGLYCSMISGSCLPLAQLGETCNPYCGWDNRCDTFCDDAQGLFCNRDETCQLPGDAGALCRSHAECALDLICNQGHVPDDPHLGECQAPSDVGQTCFYGIKDASPAAAGVGCIQGLSCVPPSQTRDRITSLPTNSLCTPGGVVTGECGYPGVCQPAHAVAMGDGCLDDRSCPDGAVCNVLPLPIASDYASGFTCFEGDCVWSGPWPGRCAPPEAPTAGESCTSAVCAPGFQCDWLGVCQPNFLGELLAECGDYGTGAMNNDFCAIGRHCEEGPQIPICRPGEPL